MIYKTGRVLFLLFLVAAASGCSGGDGEEAAEVASGAIVRVGERVLTKDHFENLLPDGDGASLSREEKNLFIRKWVEIEVLYQEALARGLNNDPRVSSMVERLEKEFLADHIIFLELRERIGVSEDEVEGYFNRRRREYTYEYRVSHILVNTIEEAGTARKLLKTKSFAWVANHHSVDPVARRGGDLGYLTKGNMIPEFESVIFDMRPGEVSDIVHSDFGYHIIKLIGTREAQVKVTLDEVRGRIISTLVMEKRRKAYNEFYESLMSSADIEFFESEYLSDVGVEGPADSAGVPEAPAGEGNVDG
ncbi:MAG: peptidylprolyl isomerase [Candidatus Krumholzibacteria bacterium]|nr:peptidylprolyl isomerase [Candidatus Krumholzibacteria bacterium]